MDRDDTAHSDINKQCEVSQRNACALAEAVDMKDERMARLLLDNGANVNLLSEEVNNKMQNLLAVIKEEASLDETDHFWTEWETGQ
jgi:hypothetical protein